MQSRKMVMVLVIVVALLPATGMASEYLVGDAQGWNTGVDYDNWAQSKELLVGDTIVFQYAAGDHDVVEVEEADYARCRVPKNAIPLKTGDDMVTLDNAGMRWFLCGKEGHCQAGQKVAVSVLPIITLRAPAPESGASPAPAHSSSNKMAAMPWCGILTVAVVAIIMI